MLSLVLENTDPGVIFSTLCSVLHGFVNVHLLERHSHNPVTTFPHDMHTTDYMYTQLMIRSRLTSSLTSVTIQWTLTKQIHRIHPAGSDNDPVSHLQRRKNSSLLIRPSNCVNTFQAHTDFGTCSRNTPALEFTLEMFDPKQRVHTKVAVRRVIPPVVIRNHSGLFLCVGIHERSTCLRPHKL